MQVSRDVLDGVVRVHLVGVGGIGMSAVARLLRGFGFQVSGSDVKESSITQDLRHEGVNVHIGHSAELVRGADLVAYSSAIPSDNPELAAAKDLGIRVEHRARVLSALMERHETSVGVTGTNGKGTVAAMITHLLREAGLEPSYAIGAVCLNLGTNAFRGASRIVVCELDESDGSFAWTNPTRLVINNLEADHLNYYRDLDGLLAKFSDYLENTRCVVHANGSDANCRAVTRRAKGDVVYFGSDEASAYRLGRVEQDGASVRFELFGRGLSLGEFVLNIPGRYQAMNAAAALSVALELGVSTDVARCALATFKGLKNRFTVQRMGGVLTVKDYMSHPTGIRCVLEAARGLGPRRVIAVFEPYRYTMVNYLHGEYREAFKGCDRVVVTRLFAAGEDPIEGIDSEFLASTIGEGGTETDYVPRMEDVPSHLARLVNEGDCVVFFGGDDLFALADRFGNLLCKRREVDK